MLIANIDRVDMDASQKAIYQAEAKTIRALMYINLTMTYQDVPLDVYKRQMLFFANIASNLKVESMHFAHRNCVYILGVIYLLCFPVWLWADNKVNTYHFKSSSTSVNFPTNEVRKLFQDSQGLSLIHIYCLLARLHRHY